MTDTTWELVGLLTCGLILLTWLAYAWSRWLVRRNQRRMREFTRGWDSRQDFAHRVAERGRCQKAGIR